MSRVGPPFAELLARSCFSFLEGASHPEELIESADALGLHEIALCDRDGLYGLPRAHARAKQLGRRVLVGAELTLEGTSCPATVALYAEDHGGYSHLCKLLTAAHRDHEKGRAGISAADVAELAEGLCAVLPLPRLPEDELARLIGSMREAFGERLSLATWRHLDGTDAERTARALAAHHRYAVPVVASARPLFHHPSRKPLADVLHCIRNKTTLDRAGTGLAANAEAFLRSPERMAALFRDRPGWLERSAQIADRCRFSLDELHYAFPSDTSCKEGESPDEALRRMVELGCTRRYPAGVPAPVRAQIEKELVLIAEIRAAPYFLSVEQIVDIARDKGILCQGRGSAANSAVCFVLGITAVDPAQSNLLFERFLSAERAEPPDIDVDFEHERREEVIQALYERYGRDRAAMVSEVICYRGRSALREVGKVFGLSTEQLDALSGLAGWGGAGCSRDRIAEVGLDPDDARLSRVLDLAGQLEGFPRHLSIHVGGFVLSSEPLDRVAPIEPARMENRTVIPWDKDDLDDLGFFKVDVLGLGMLTAIRKTLAIVHERGPRRGERFDPIEALPAIPQEDPEVYEAIGHADTVGVFQIESRAQMSMLPRLKPKTFYDLVIEVAIVRPGPIQGGMVHPYLRRRTGKEAAVAPHESLAPILKRTLGVPLFQEQVMQIAMVGAGYTPGEADQLRRDMAAWKRHGRLERHYDRLMQGFAARGISRRFGEQLCEQIKGFGEYGFPESHAASFAKLVYASAWLKVHHPAAFACGLLNSQPMGFYSPSSIVRDAQAHGVTVKPVCVVASTWDNLIDDEGALRLGMRQISGLGQAAAAAIVAARTGAPFSDVGDLVRRARLKKNEIEALAEAGALSAIVSSRREALWRARAPRAGGLFHGLGIEPEVDVGLPPLSPVEQLVLDYGRVGLSLHDHPMKHLRHRLDLRGVRRASELPACKDRSSLTVAGLVIGRQRPATASGITFITLEDETGILNLVVRERVFAEQYLVARHAKIILARGRLEKEGEVIHVLVRSMERLDLPSTEPLSARSRDFH